MKKTMTALAIAAIFIACNSKPKSETDTANSVAQADTMNVAHNSFTDRGADVNMNGVSDTIVSREGVQYVKVDPNAPVTNNQAAAQTKRTSASHTSTNKTTGSSGSAGTSVSSGSTASESSTGTVSSTPTVVKKKGWSNAAKGTVIGAGTGAVAGAIVSKKKVKGAIIGGVLGAGGGFVVGKVLDKKAENKNQ